MNKNIASAFENKKAFIGFVTAGDPDLETSRQILLEMAKNGCDLIEVGILRSHCRGAGDPEGQHSRPGTGGHHRQGV